MAVKVHGSTYMKYFNSKTHWKLQFERNSFRCPVVRFCNVKLFHYQLYGTLMYNLCPTDADSIAGGSAGSVSCCLKQDGGKMGRAIDTMLPLFALRVLLQGTQQVGIATSYGR
jgi:hypothetical protein